MHLGGGWNLRRKGVVVPWWGKVNLQSPLVQWRKSICQSGFVKSVFVKPVSVKSGEDMWTCCKIEKGSRARVDKIVMLHLALFTLHTSNFTTNTAHRTCHNVKTLHQLQWRNGMWCCCQDTKTTSPNPPRLLHKNILHLLKSVNFKQRHGYLALNQF